MEAGASLMSMMVMYADESVDIRYENGAQLLLSPCGSEFMLARGSVPAEHPLQTPVRVRQRTRFTTSAYKELIITALAFRNKYASRPYLPEELTTPIHKQPLLSINLEVQWPAWSSCDAEFLPGGETIIKSEDKLTLLTLSPSGEEFFVEYACMLSQPLHQQAQNFNRDPERIPDNQQQYGRSLTHLKVKFLQTSSDDIQEFHQKEGKTSCCPQMVTHEAKPEAKYQSVALLQHHSCHAVAPHWCYPLSLALRHWRARVSNPGGDGEGRSRHSKADQTLNTSDLSNEERAFLLPQALPLNCSSPHFHSWKFQDPDPKNQLDQDSPTEMVKVMWHQGVTYRILDQDVPVIEVSPGDGSVIRSHGVLSMYFIHYKPECQSVQTKVKEITYHMNGLPPDMPGQLYSVCSVLSCASRLLTRYNEVKKLRIPATPSCLLQLNVLFKPPMVDGILSNPSPLGQHENNSETVESWSDLVAAELAKIQRCILTLEDGNKERGEKGCAPNGLTEIAHETMSEGCVAEALQKTSKAIQDIDAFITAAKQTLSGIAQFDC
ncbi:uncharacterized protein C5orf34 homolog isoform X2 [Hippocampus comes]|uniref:uncharacterized protein C5orf34 homolog isoform X2 n=1 Tax=Hippocampus comes TaxID=109280 RepID=UPI00094EDC82|nr:PREDICTED: uncharacterized protein C5orf34 homolog isoform X2 [Hippocampus comes]